MNLSRSISKKIKKSLISDSLLYVDEVNDHFIRGWAASKSCASNSVVIEIRSSVECVCIVANQFRADVRRSGQHSTGFCGFKFDLSTWEDKAAEVRVLGECEQTESADFNTSFFIHIPKTAGTSFKRAAEKYFGIDGVVRNYGAKSPETTPWVKDVILKDNNYPLLYEKVTKAGVGLYTGHVNAFPTANVFRIQDIITFIRDPYEQVISHFNHYSRWYGYEKSVEEFVVNPGFKNLQSRHLKGLPIQLVGFIGITEQYSESISLFNKYSGWNLKAREDNTNDKKNVSSVDDSLKKLIASKNENDIRLYTYVVKLFEERIALESKNKEWCYSFIDRFDEQCVSGVAYMANEEGCVSLLISAQGMPLGRCVANELRPGLLRFGVPNKGFVGFSFVLPSGIGPDDISVAVESTGQKIQRKINL